MTLSSENEILHEVDISDPANYLTGPIQDQILFPSTNGRSFSSSFFTKKMANGERVKREWLVYSKKLDAVFCFCCLLFGSESNVFKTGYKDWQRELEQSLE